MFRRFVPLVLAIFPLTAKRTGYYEPVTPPPQQKPPCGHIGTPPCEHNGTTAQLPPNATAEQLFNYSNEQYKKGDKHGAIQSLQRAADMGLMKAKRALGTVYAFGQSVPQDVPRGMALLEEVARTNDPVAAYHLGRIYDDGKIVAANPSKAVAYYTASANGHFWLGEFSLGIDTEIGRGTAHNRALAIQLMESAAAHTQQDTPANYADFLRRAGTRRFQTGDELANAYMADYVRRHTAAALPSQTIAPGSAEWTNRITGNSTACYFGNAPYCPKR